MVDRADRARRVAPEHPAAGARGRRAGLRGGWFHADYMRYDDHAVIDLHDARLVRDLRVRGAATLSCDLERPRLKARVTIHGAGTPDGTLRIVGRYWFDTIFGTLRVSGEIGGRRIEVVVPGNRRGDELGTDDHLASPQTKGLIPAGYLDGLKARILLSLLLRSGMTRDDVRMGFRPRLTESLS